MGEQGTNSPEQSTELRQLDHNGFFNNTFQMKRLAKGFLRVTLPKGLRDCLDLDGLTIEPSHLTDDVFTDRFADVIYRVPIKGMERYVDFFVVLEHKSYNDLWTIFQLWQYVALVCRLGFKTANEENRVSADYRLPPVIAIILHHGESRFTGKTELSELFLQLPDIEKYLPKLQAVLFDLNAVADEDIPFDPEVPELKLVLMALKVVFRKDVTTKITEILEEIKSLTDDPVIQDIIRTVWHYLVSSAPHMERYEELFAIINNVVEVESMPTRLEKAEVRGQAKMVLKALRKRFENVPSEIEEAVLAMSDSIALESLLEHAIDSETLDEFVTML
ncbi:MAG: Rpn family recombination-promoting nuclease/putative transposase [Planctomycetaceae bacterium]|jgi:hypothetical protein|nr:Rpn family recombination-promoting nuclease/putative transposase [Planctomycetaceae bacterium]